MAVPLSEIMSDAKDRADLLNNTLVGDVTWRRWANRSVERLYRLLVTKAPARFHKSASFTLTGSVNTVALAADFRQLRQRGVTKDPTVPGSRRTLNHYNFGERDAQGALPIWGYGREIAFDIQAGNIIVEPANIAAGNYAYYYLFGPVKWATNGTQDSVDIATVFEPYVDFVADCMAIKGLMKEESLDTAAELRRELFGPGGRVEEIQAEFSDSSDPATIIDVDQVGGRRWP
jgi:hypothetical protein